MSVLRLLGIVTALAVISACNETPTPPQLEAELAVAADGFGGKPVVERVVFEDAFQFPCATFMMDVQAFGKQVTQAWFYPSGGLHRLMLHLNLDATFANLSSGLSATNNANQNVVLHFDEFGRLTREVINGSPQKIHEYEDNNNRLRFYIIGHRVTTIDHSVSPPVVESTFSGRSNEDMQMGPCVALGDPA